MINKKFLFIIAGIAAALVISVVIVDRAGQQTQQNRYMEDNLALKQKLAEHGILMSSPIKLQAQNDIEKYCSFFTSEEKQKLVEYCTSTELKDKSGRFLGNIHLVGSYGEPKIAIALIQTDPFMTEIDSVKIVFDDVIQSLVCDCWQQEKPDNISDVGEWVEGLRQFHLSDTKPHSKSKQISMGSKTIQMELTTNEDGYLWQLFITSTSV